MRVFLIGDSIRLYSEKYVRENIDSKVNLSSPSENCESSNEIKEKPDSWLSGESFDLIHIKNAKIGRWVSEAINEAVHA